MALRRSPIRKKRSTPRRGQLSALEVEIIRVRVYEETGGRCELQTMPNCMRGVLPLFGGVRERWHLVHLKNKRRFGWGRHNLAGGCPVCHLDGAHTKGVKPKQLEEEWRLEGWRLHN